MAQNTEVDISHGNDVGIWICEATGIAISPCLFIQSVCSERFPVSMSAKWMQAGPAPKAFQKSGTIPLLYGECGRVRPHASYIHLFSIEAPPTQSFERESSLCDWQFPAGIAGLVVIFDKEYSDSASVLSLSHVLSTLKLTSCKNRSLEWVKAQHVPFVIAAMGFDSDPHLNQFRQRYNLQAHIPIVAGPALASGKNFNDSRKNFFETIFSSQQRIFDPEYAKQILGTLCQLIENERERDIRH